MFEDRTYESILSAMLSKVSDDIDKREGSIIYDALAPAALELAVAYTKLDELLNETFADTAGRESLIKRTAERGIKPSLATYAEYEAEFNIEVPVSSRFTNGGYFFAVKSKTDGFKYRVVCETAGSKANSLSGNLIPVDYIDGLETAKLVNLLIPGEDDEDVESLRTRYFNSFKSQAFGGNVADYKEKTRALPGVGGVKVYPTWNGGGTVKLVFLTSDYKPPSEVLVDEVQTAIDPLQNQGEGLGLAPIGHVVTVEGVKGFNIDITTNITYRDDWTWDDIKELAEKAVDEYFTELSTTWSDSENLVVRISQIETKLLALPGVLDISETALNGSTSNIQLEPDDIPIRGEIVG